MKKILGLTVILLLMMAMTSASASWYFAQDDFWVYMPDGEGSAGQDAFSEGTILQWDVNQIVGWFELSGTNTAPAALEGNQIVTLYDQATLKIWGNYHPIHGYSNLFWEGDGFWTTVVNSDQSPYDASLYDRPLYETEPTTYTGVGDGWFDYSAGSWTEWHAIDVEWLGTYNWRYHDDLDYMIGNAQAKITMVPEPGSIATLAAGLFGMSAWRIRLRRSK